MRPRATARSRHPLALTALAAIVAVTLAACGSSTDDGASDPAPQTPAESGATEEPAAADSSTTDTPDADGADTDTDGAEPADSGAAAYPITLTTPYGDVTIPEAPERIVVLTADRADELLALGVTPTAVAGDPATIPVYYPWLADDIIDLVDPNLLTASYELNLEAIAQAQPDLILGATWLITDQQTFDRANQIAPTVIEDSSALNVDWDDRLRTTAATLGKTAEAEEIIAEIEDEFAAIGAEVPGITDMTYQFVRVDPDGYGFGNGSVLELFGLQPAANQDNTQNGPTLSKENTAQLDADLLGVFAATDELRQAIDADPLFQALPAVAGGTVFYADFPIAFAANTPAPHALHWLKDQIADTIRALA